MPDSPRLAADISSLKGGGKHILSNCLQSAIDLWIVGRRFSHAEQRSNVKIFDKKIMVMTVLNSIKRKAAEVFIRFRSVT